MNLFESVAAATSRIWRAAFVAAALLLVMPNAGARAQELRKATISEAVGNKSYTFVEEMPELPGGGGQAAIVTFIQKQIRLPLFCDRVPVRSRAVFEFTVAKTGAVCNIRILQSIDGRVDSAIVRAVRALPLLTPGRQQGLPVSVKYTMPISFHFQ